MAHIEKRHRLPCNRDGCAHGFAKHGHNAKGACTVDGCGCSRWITATGLTCAVAHVADVAAPPNGNGDQAQSPKWCCDRCGNTTTHPWLRPTRTPPVAAPGNPPRQPS
jgi:hypothetical protein